VVAVDILGLLVMVVLVVQEEVEQVVEGLLLLMEQQGQPIMVLVEVEERQDILQTELVELEVAVLL
jgi:hypothetical protein